PGARLSSAGDTSPQLDDAAASDLRTISPLASRRASQSLRSGRSARTAVIAFLFPGQGAPAVGMGRGLFDPSPGAPAALEEANDALGFDLARLVFEGPEAELALTANTQPAVLTVSVAAAAVAAERGLAPALASGHSLGEYSALVVAGALAFPDAVRLVRC